jgi:histidinol-phosphate aminotransferase
MPDISYSFYPVFAKLWDISVQCVSLRPDWSLEPSDFLKAYEASGRPPRGGIVLANPNAPTAMALKAEALLPLVENMRKAGWLVLIDEAYCPFAAPGTSLVPYVNDYDNLLTVHTLSKAWALAGMRIGFAIGNEALIEGLCRIRDSFNSYTLDSLAQAAGCAAMRDSAYYEATTKALKATRERVGEALKDRGFTVLPSETNFIFVKSPRWSGAEFAADLRKKGILVRHFKGPRVEDFVRVSIGTEADMDKFLECINADN